MTKKSEAKSNLPVMDKAQEPQLNISYTVVKRNGSLVPFHRERILKAIMAAFRDTKKIPTNEPLEKEIEQSVHKLTNLVVEQVLNLASKGACLTVEGIQDVVEVTLMKNGFHDVAKDYIIYRDKQKEKRKGSYHHLKIYRHDGTTLVRFNPIKIAATVENAFRRSHKIDGLASEEVLTSIDQITQQIVAESISLAEGGEALHFSTIQDLIERHLMDEKYYDVAKEYIIHRATSLTPKKVEPAPIKDSKQRTFKYITKEGKEKNLTENALRRKVEYACRGLENIVSIHDLVETTILNFYEGIKEHEVELSTILAAKSKIEIDPAYSTVASRLLLDSIYRETMQISASDHDLEKTHKKYLKTFLKKAIAEERAHPALLDFDLEKLSNAMDLSRDDLFAYLGLQTLYDRYFIHTDQKRLETPQIFWMRVSMGLAIQEGEDKNKRAIEFYNVLSQFHFVSSTPTLFNAGTMHSQLSSCYLSTVQDDLHGIFKIIADDAQLSKWAGGIGNDWTNVRATGATIKGTNGSSQGVIPFLKVANDTAVAVNQCFAPDTPVYTGKGVKPIHQVQSGDVVLGISGTYREVLETFAYNQKDAMVEVHTKHGIEPITVTAGHPLYAIQGVPLEQSNQRTNQWLEKGKVRADWIEAGSLKRGDYVAQVIPKEIIAVPEFSVQDARLYGILLGDGHLSKNGSQWGLSCNPMKDSATLEFVKKYLNDRNIHYWETKRNECYMQIHWAAGLGAVRNGSTGRYESSGEPTIPFSKDDLYDSNGKKHIAPRFSHLPKPQALALIQGLIETDGNVSRGKEVTFSNTSETLVEGLRYQLLRLGIPTAGNYREREHSHEGTRVDGTKIQFSNQTNSFDLRIPAVQEIAELVGARPLTKKNWIERNGFIFTRVKQTKSIEPTPFVYDLKVEGDESYMISSCLAHNGGKRKGAMCAYLETWHLDIEDFLELRKNTGDERRRTHDMNTANWIPDLFMKRVQQNSSWTLFSPNDVPDLHDLYGKAFEKRYAEYEKKAENGEIRLFKKVEAVQLWRKMLSMLFETGHPWITFKDPSNIRSPQDHKGVVHSSNLCTEILLNTSKDETAVCNLGSVNLSKHTTKEGLDQKLLAETVRTAIRMLDNVIDINFYPIEEARNANLRHRPIGLGVMGFQDALYQQNLSYASHEAVEFADQSMEMISYYAILSSTELAKERGTYSSYKGSKWDRGLLPIDTIDILEEERGMKIDIDRSSRMNWDLVRESIKKYGMRNSNTMAIAPTATIANITNVIPSIEPIYKHLFVKSNLSGEFTIANPHLIQELKKYDLWDYEMIDDLKYFDGSIREIERVPQEVKDRFPCAFDVEPEWIIECAARRQKWIDMGQSLNLYLAEPSGKKLNQMYMLAWEKGLKTTYYCRTLAATQIEKSTMDVNKRGLQPRWMKNKSASSKIEVDREEKVSAPVCNLEEGCESCQ